jgi:hypothetical protein
LPLQNGSSRSGGEHRDQVVGVILVGEIFEKSLLLGGVDGAGAAVVAFVGEAVRGGDDVAASSGLAGLIAAVGLPAMVGPAQGSGVVVTGLS